MPNQRSPDSSKITYIEDRSMHEYLKELSKRQSVTVGELIRRAVAKTYGSTSRAFYEVEPDAGMLEESLTHAKIVARSQVPYPEQSGVTFTVACEEVSISTSFEDSVVVRLREVQDAYWKQEHPYVDAGADAEEQKEKLA